MAKRKILLLHTRHDPWIDFLSEYFEETQSAVFNFHEGSSAKIWFEKNRPEIVFCDPSLLTRPFLSSLEIARNASQPPLMFGTGGRPSPLRARFDGLFSDPSGIFDFQRELMRSLPFAPKLRVLIVDDDPEIGRMICDFFERRVHPVFETIHFQDAREGFSRLLSEVPDVLILDIKMPGMDGREFYCGMRARGLDVPTIVFFDSVFGEELAEMRRAGKPAVIEKGSVRSTLPELIELTRKVSFFS